MIRIRHTPLDSPRSTGVNAAVAGVIAFALFFPLTAADLYLSADRSGILSINATFISFVVLSPVFGLILLAELAHDRGRRLCSMYLSVSPLLFAFALLTILQLGGGFLPSAYWFRGGRFIYLPLYNFVLLCIAFGIAFNPAFRRHHRKILGVCLLAAAGSIFIDLAFRQTFSTVATRPAGLEQNANHAAAICVFLAVATVDWTRSRIGDVLLWLFAGSAVVATLSRGGMIMLAVAFLCYVVVSARSGPSRLIRNLSILSVALIGVVALYSVSGLGSTVYSSEENDRPRLLAAIFSGDVGTLMEDSRVGLASDYMDLIAQRPIWGYGTAFTMSQAQGPHNMFLLLWLENGVLGLSAYVMVLVVFFWHFRKLADARGQVFCISLFVFSFFSHNLLTTRPMIVNLGLLGALASVARSSQSRPRTKCSLRTRSCAMADAGARSPGAAGEMR